MTILSNVMFHNNIKMGLSGVCAVFVEVFSNCCVKGSFLGGVNMRTGVGEPPIAYTIIG